MNGLGIIFGLCAAFCQSMAYLGTRHYVQPRGGGSRTLLVLSHVLMGVASVVILPLVWPEHTPDWGRIADPLVQVCFWYMLGQFGLMMALRYAEPSRVSPMLAFKLVVLAGLTTLLKHTPITPLQWLAIGLCIGGTVSLSYGHGKSRPFAFVTIALTCMAYSLSDWNIGRLIQIADVPGWRGPVWATFLSYAVCGVAAVFFLPRLGSRKVRDWVDAAPFAGSWLLAMIFLFACFGLVGVVYGNILQSTRALMSVLMGAALTRWGMLHIENVATRRIFARRMAAALLVVAAVVLYNMERQRLAATPPAATVAR